MLLAFLFLIPIFCAAKAAEFLTISQEELLVSSVLVLLFSLAPLVCNQVLYREEAITTVTLLSLEALFLLFSFYLDETAVIYILVPVVSMVYCDQRLSRRICLLCYVGMFLVRMYRGVILENNFDGQAAYLDFIKYTLEFLAVAAIVCLGSVFIERLAPDGGQETARSDGSEMPAHGGLAGTGSAREEKKDQGPQESAYRVEALFYSIEKDMRAMIKGKNKFFELDLDEQLPVRLFGAREEIRRALSGICSDLLMYRQEAAVKMRVSCHDGILPKKNQTVTLEIMISGNTDITAITANRTALGYYLSRGIIERLQGNFEDLSDSENAVFRICLLQRVEDECTIREEKEKQLREMNQIKNSAASAGDLSFFHKEIKVLVVDDNRESRKLIDAILNSMGVQVVCADNGAEAIELLESKEYQMVFMDQMMPGKSGPETVKELRYLDDPYYQNLPIVMMTVNTREEARKEYEGMGFTDCISKPIQVHEVKAGLQRFIKDDYPLTYAEYQKLREDE